MNPLRISVALCTYNGALFLGEQLESIASQTRLPDELVVFDDRSTDDTSRILREFAENAPIPMRLSVNAENIGSTKNFERAIQACQGDIIALSDQDDVWHPEKLARIEAAFDASPETGLVFSDGEVMDAELRPLGHRLWDAFLFTPRLRRRFREGKTTEVLLKYNVVTGATMALRSRHLPLLLPIPECVVHDWWIALLLSFVAPLEMIPEPLVRYRQHGGNQIGGKMAGFVEKVGKSIGITAVQMRTMADGYQRAYEKLQTQPDLVDHGDLLLLQGKVSHFLTRSSLPRELIPRFFIVARELMTGGYFRYSLGVKSALRDLLSPPLPGA